MSYEVIAIAPFRREAKRLIRKYPSLKSELGELGILLAQHPETGVALGNNTYKIRLAIASKGKGKSGGARIITHVYLHANTVFLLTIYDKSEREDVTDRDIKELIRAIDL
jgi:hypothetical protein